MKLKILAVAVLVASLCAVVPLASATITPQDTMEVGPRITADVTTQPDVVVGKVHLKDVTLVYASGLRSEQPTVATISCKGVHPFTAYECRWKVIGPDPNCPDCGPITYVEGTIPIGTSGCPPMVFSDDKGNIDATVWAAPGTVKAIQDALLANPNSYLTVYVGNY